MLQQQDRRWFERQVYSQHNLAPTHIFATKHGLFTLAEVVHYIQYETPAECWPATQQEIEEQATPNQMQQYLAMVATTHQAEHIFIHS